MRKSVQRLLVSLIWFLSCNDVYAAAFGEPIQLSDPIASESVKINDFQISSDGRVAVYFVISSLGENRLISVPIDGGDTIVLSDVGASSMDVDSFVISPDSKTVLFAGEIDSGNKLELFSVGIRDNNAIRISSTSAPQNVSKYQLTGDGQTVVYMAKSDTSAGVEIFRAPILGGSPPVIIHSLLTAPQNVTEFEITPDNETVVLLGDLRIDEVVDLYSVPLAGGDMTQLSPNISGESDVFSFRISPDSEYVVYRSDHEVDERFEIYQVELTGGASVKINGVLQGLVDVGDLYAIGLDGEYIVYLAKQQTDTKRQLYIYHLGEAAAVKVGGESPHFNRVSNYEVSHDGTFLAFLGLSGEGWQVYSTLIGSEEVDVLTPASGSSPTEIFYQISRDNKNVVVLTDFEHESTFDLYRASVDGTDLVKLNTPVNINNGVHDDFIISSDDVYVYFRIEDDTSDFSRFFSSRMSPDENSVAKLDLTPTFNEIYSFTVSGDDKHLLFTAKITISGKIHLFSIERVVDAEDESLCFPIISSSQKAALICL